MLRIRTIFLTSLFLSMLSINAVYANIEPTEPDCNCPGVTGESATSTATTMTVSWTASASFISYIVQVQKGGVTHFNATSTGSSVVIVGTSPATTYTVKVIGICGDGQYGAASPLTVTTVSATPTCGEGDVSNDVQHAQYLSNTYWDQIEAQGDVDMYYFILGNGGGCTVTLQSLLNDYELSFSMGGSFQLSDNPGTSSESITFTNTSGKDNKVLLSVAGFGTAYNTYDCYEIKVEYNNFNGGGGSGMLASGGGADLVATLAQDASSLLLGFDSAFEADDQVNVQVFSLEGRLVLTESTQVYKGEKQIKLDLPVVSDGIYFVNATGNFGEKSQKFVVAK